MTKLEIREQVHDGSRDFDFFIGTWTGHNRRLRERLKGSTSCEEFESTVVDRKILNGAGNMDEVTFYRESGPAHCATFRLYDAHSGQWSLYWADGIHGALQLPEVGSFKDGVGEFYCQEPFEGRMIISRFIWSEITDTTCRWEQAFSEDGGKTWETNWIMDFTRKD
jgi:hypothetical protein